MNTPIRTYEEIYRDMIKRMERDALLSEEKHKTEIAESERQQPGALQIIVEDLVAAPWYMRVAVSVLFITGLAVTVALIGGWI